MAFDLRGGSRGLAGGGGGKAGEVPSGSVAEAWTAWGRAPGVLVSPASSLYRREAIVVSTMSSQKGNVARSRPQRHQNTFSFKNDKFDKSVQTKVGTCLLHQMGL